MSNKNIEILSPAGSMEALISAVRCGANAIYLGGTDFSARQNATNFTDDELVQAVEFCHLHNVKVHQAINTIVFDTQFERLINTVNRSAEIGVDAFIVQDLGVLSIVKQAVPDMPLHASTQMTIHTKQGAILAKELGFSRVVIARELSKEQIAEICTVGIETEVFVHGALCMCVSGQCYMSAMIGSRSANRGLCAQACRLPFSAIDDEKRCDLSLKDMSLVENIPELIEIGVTSIKIEGRMKRPEYVAAATTACRAAADGKNPDMETLKAVFSRSGFTDGYFKDELGADMFGIRGRDDVVSANDVLPQLKELYRKENKVTNIQFVIEIIGNCPSKLTVTDAQGNTAAVTGEVPQIAQNRPSDLAQAEKQLSKLGDTVYEFDGVTGTMDEGLMLPASVFNELRRNVILELDKVRLVKNKADYTIRKVELNFTKALGTKKRTIRLELHKASQLQGLNLGDVEQIILPLNEVVSKADSLLNTKEILTIAPPRFMAGNEKEVIEKLKALKEKHFSHLYCNNLAHIEIGKLLGYTLHGGFGLNIANSLALKELSKLGLADTTLSFELKLNQILQLGNFMPFGIIAHGSLPLMLTRNCPIKGVVGCKNCTKTLTDRTGRTFEVVCDGTTTEILNSDKLFMADRLGEIEGVSFITLKFYGETTDEINETIEQYRTGSKVTLKEFTRGLYYRGIQ